MSPIKNGNGKIYVTSINLSGPILKPDQWTYNVSGTGLGIDVTTHLNQKQIENLSCQYHISDDFLSLKKIKMKINTISWMEPFIEKKDLDSILVPFDIENGSFQTGIKHSSFNGKLTFTTGPELYIDLNGESLSSLALNSIKFIVKL